MKIKREAFRHLGGAPKAAALAALTLTAAACGSSRTAVILNPVPAGGAVASSASSATANGQATANSQPATGNSGRPPTPATGNSRTPETSTAAGTAAGAGVAQEACPSSGVVGGPLGIPAAQLTSSSTPAKHGSLTCAYTTSDASTFVEIIIGRPDLANYYHKICRNLNSGAQSCAWANDSPWNYTVEITPPDESEGKGILRAIAAS